MYEIVLTIEAEDDLRGLRKHDQQLVTNEILSQLTYEPTVETRNRKHLKPNPLAEWELRIDKFRVFYDVLENEGEIVVRIVKVAAIGYKRGKRLFIHGEEYEL